MDFALPYPGCVKIRTIAEAGSFSSYYENILFGRRRKCKEHNCGM